jgi:hypothetical protein
MWNKQYLLPVLIIMLVLAACGSPAPDTPTTTPEADPVALTRVAIIAEATAAAAEFTAEAAPEETADPIERIGEVCVPGSYYRFHAEPSQLLENALEDGGVSGAAVSITTEEETDCETVEVVSALYAINIPVPGLTDQQALGDLAAEVLAIMTDLPRQLAPERLPALLSLRFDREEQQVTVEADLDAALLAFDDGQRGVELLQTLDELPPDD